MLRKKDIITEAARNARVSRTEAQVIVAGVLDQIISALERGEDVRMGTVSLRKLVEQTSG